MISYDETEHNFPKDDAFRGGLGALFQMRAAKRNGTPNTIKPNQLNNTVRRKVEPLS